MSDEPRIRHKNFMIELKSFRSDGLWVPNATVSGPESEREGARVVRDLGDPSPTQAGANDISGISFTLRQDRPARDRALTEATREAMSKAEVVASALGRKVTRVVEVQEEGFVRPPQPVYQAEAFMAKRDSVATPIEVGSLDVTSRVLLIVEVE